jgi:hypothetical protein
MFILSCLSQQHQAKTVPCCDTDPRQEPRQVAAEAVKKTVASAFIVQYTDVGAACQAVGLHESETHGYKDRERASHHPALMSVLELVGKIRVFPKGPLYLWRSGRAGPAQFFARMNNPGWVVKSSVIWQQFSEAEKCLHWVIRPPRLSPLTLLMHVSGSRIRVLICTRACSWEPSWM